MRLIRKAEVVASVPEHWRKTYEKKSGWIQLTKPLENSKDIYERLMAAQPLTEDAADRIIGNNTWTRLTCNECGESVDLLVEIGQEPDYDSDTASICIKCIWKAHVMMVEASKEQA